MIHVEVRVGRLMELRIRSPVEATEVAPFLSAVGGIMKTAGSKIICAGDLRQADVFTAEVASQLVGLMKSDNPNIERSAFLISNKAAVFGNQLERMLAKASNPNRRTFHDAFELRSWLMPILSPDEKRRLTAFFVEGA